MTDDGLYEIPSVRVAKLITLVEKLNKKCEKLGCPSIGVTAVSTTTKKSGEGFVEISLIKIEGPTPKLPGWSFEGVVDFSDPAVEGFILRMAPGRSEDLSRDFRATITSDPRRCDHCGSKRNRVATFIVRHESGTYHLVGRSCLKDFTGHDNPAAIGAYFEILENLMSAASDMERDGSGSRLPNLIFDVDKFMAVICTESRLHGFTTRSRAADSYPPMISTSDVAILVLDPPQSYREESQEFLSLITDEDRSLASKILAYIPELWQNKEEIELSDYELNMKNSFATGLVSRRTAGLVASAYVCYKKSQTKTVDLTNSTHQGALKKRLTLRLHCYETKIIDGYYGSTQIVKLHDDSGNCFVWFNSGSRSAEAGNAYNVKGTVKKFDEYNGIKQTHLTRCVLTDAATIPDIP